MRGSPIRMAGALALCAAAFSAMAQRHENQQAILKADGCLPNEPTSGSYNYRGGPGNRAHQRAAQKRRNVLRHRKACRS